MSELIKVGMADLKTGKSPDSIISYGLGSCVGIALYDAQTKIGGLAHIMLPDSTQARATDNTAKFADTVDLPTPPLPEETAITFFTKGSIFPGSGRAA